MTNQNQKHLTVASTNIDRRPNDELAEFVHSLGENLS
jgi:hypothetical protein